MSLGRTYSVALVGLNGYIVEVEADIGQTLPAFIILGLPDASLNEAKERIRSAAQNSGIPLSRRKITANLIPASLPKSGSGFDLAITMAALCAAGDIRTTGRTVFIAELGLDGRLRPVRGVLPAVMAAVQAGYSEVVVAQANAAEAALVPGAHVKGYRTLARLALYFGADPQELALDFEPDDEPPGEETSSGPGSIPDMRDVSGQAEARRALEVA
ncbi:MAG: ATP-binding protein, partial [Actinomycetota bacterium]|nr:ATP-binding protein [Actinomycetota bacterium]